MISIGFGYVLLESSWVAEDGPRRDINGQGGGDRTLSGFRGFGYGLKPLSAGAPGNMTSSRRLSYCLSSRTDRRFANVGPFGCIGLRCAMKKLIQRASAWANSLPTRYIWWCITKWENNLHVLRRQSNRTVMKMTSIDHCSYVQRDQK